jgi:two-component system alkaline phosphatase synthesis response regulator PhoP
MEPFPDQRAPIGSSGEARAEWRDGSRPLYRLGIVSPVAEPSAELARLVEQEGLASKSLLGDDVSAALANPGDVDALLLDLTQADPSSAMRLAARGLDQGLPLLLVLSPRLLSAVELRIVHDDFIVCPWSLGELIIRVRRIVERRRQTPGDETGVIRGGDLVIDTNRYDVFVADRPVVLTFKEYELLKLLASHPGRVFTREALLEQVWGYEYFGGTRTVDVHVRRVRSKTEDAAHTFIETVWNVGYRFRA